MIPHVELARPLLTADQERALARRIEAGVYAQHLLDGDPGRHLRSDLAAVRDDGRHAWQELWLSNLKLVVKLAAEAGRRHNLVIDELIQDGCIGLAGAMQRFDHRRGLRLSTLAHEYVRRAVAASAARRCGQLEGPPYRHRVRTRLRHEAAAGAPDVAPSLRALADRVGVGADTAASALVHHTGLEEAEPVAGFIDPDLERVTSHGPGFLELLDGSGEFLRRRFGFDGHPRTRAELAAELGVSVTNVMRMESRALQRARRLLEADVCRVPA